MNLPLTDLRDMECCPRLRERWPRLQDNNFLVTS